MNLYEPHHKTCCIDSFVDPPDGQKWDNCPKCGLRPKIWAYDNGRHTACGCHESKYDYFSIHAESIMSVHSRTNGKGLDQYDCDGLRKNWNHWCRGGEELFKRNVERW